MEKKQKNSKILDGIFLILLILYPLRNIRLGLEVTDGLYSAGNYRFPDTVYNMWLFSTYLANAVGSFLSRLPGGNCLIGLRFYSALFISLLTVLVYLFFTRLIKIEKWLAFLGTLLAVSLCWAPVTILYHYLTYIFFDLGLMLLYTGLVRENRRLLFLAGVFLGMNVLVRFPNITEAALILSVWYYGFLMHKRLKDVLQETGVCILGFFAGIGAVLISIMLKYGMSEYISAIARLMNMPADAEDYSLYSMVVTVLLDYKTSSKWLMQMLLLVLAGCLCSMLAYRAGDKKIPRIFSLCGKICFLFSIAVLFRRWHAMGVFNVKYYTYESMFQWTVIVLILAVVSGIVTLFRKKSSRNEKLFASMLLIFIAVTPLGSNNHLYPIINNMFLIYPYVLATVWKLLKKLLQAGYLEIGKQKRKVSFYPVTAMLAVFTLTAVMQGLLFGAVFTFRDGMSGQKRDTKIENNAVLKGIVTNAELAEAVEGLTAYVEEAGLGGKELILYGDVPGVSYILDMPSAISTTWPDLRSYGYDLLAEDMEKLERSDDITPVIILGTDIDKYMQGDTEQLAETVVSAYKENPKWRLVETYMKEKGYERSYVNSRFALYNARK